MYSSAAKSRAYVAEASRWAPLCTALGVCTRVCLGAGFTGRDRFVNGVFFLWEGWGKGVGGSSGGHKNKASTQFHNGSGPTLSHSQMPFCHFIRSRLVLI